jgi:hypothetical protein
MNSDPIGFCRRTPDLAGLLLTAGFTGRRFADLLLRAEILLFMAIVGY